MLRFARYGGLPELTPCFAKLVQSKTVAGGSMADYVQQHTYDALGRPDTTSTLLDALYTTRREYDDWGRLISEQHQHGYDPAKAYARRYNAWGQLERIERNGQAIWTATALDAAGRVTGAKLGNNLTVVQDFNSNTGRLFHGTVGTQLAEGYTYDVLGNVKDRSQQWGGISFTETFEYDGLNRLSKSTILGYPAHEFRYDVIGNIVSKTGVGSGDYQYPAAKQARPHAVTYIPGIGEFKYDANGNLESGAGRTISWNSFDMPVTISRESNSSTFYYGPDHQRVKQVRGSTTVWYAGAMEVETGSAGTVVKTYLPNALGVEIDKAGSTQLYYTHRDRLGSVMAMSNETGALSEMLAYDSWGRRREQATPATPDKLDGQLDSKGFTGHEMLDQLDLVHMNGRVYDPLVARFLSADPIIQEPEHSQSYNRYTYVWNNPTNLTDPTGFQALGVSQFADNNGNCDKRCQQLEKQLQEEAQRHDPHGWKVGSNSRDNSGSRGNANRSPANTQTNFVRTSFTSVSGFANDGTGVQIIHDTWTRKERTYGTADQVMGQWFAFNPFEQIARGMGATKRQAFWFGLGAMIVANPRQGLATGASEAVFWSGLGRGGAETAAAWAAKNGGVTLESALASRGINLPVWDAGNPAVVAAWRKASIDFAAGARGEIRVLQGEFLRSDAIWRAEFSALKANPNVTSIRAINPSTGMEVLLWAR